MSLKLIFVDSVPELFPFSIFSHFECQSAVIPLWKLDTCQTVLQELSIHGGLGVMFPGEAGVWFCWWGVERGKVEVKSMPRKMFSDGHRLVGRRTVCLLQSGLWGAWPWRVLVFSGSTRESSWCMGETQLPALEMLVSRACGILVCSARIWEELDLKDEESQPWQKALKESVKSRLKELTLLLVIP